MNCDIFIQICYSLSLCHIIQLERLSTSHRHIIRTNKWYPNIPAIKLNKYSTIYYVLNNYNFVDYDFSDDYIQGDYLCNGLFDVIYIPYHLLKNCLKLNFSTTNIKNEHMIF